MATRRFSAANDEIRTAIGSCNLTGAFTMAVLMKRNANGVWHGVFGNATSGGASTPAIEISPADQVSLVVAGSNFLSAATIVVADGWVLLMVSKPTGTATARLHLYKGGAWTHQNLSGTPGNPASQAGGTVRWGEWQDVDDYDGWVAVSAEWNVELTDTNCEDIITAGQKTSSLYTAAGTTPIGIWELNQAVVTDSVIDLSGNGADTTGTGGQINGTTIDTGNDPPGWTFDGISAGPPPAIMTQYTSAMDAMKPSGSYL